MDPIKHINLLGLIGTLSYLVRIVKEFVTMKKSSSILNAKIFSTKLECDNTEHGIYLHEKDAQLVMDSLDLCIADKFICSDVLSLKGAYVLLEEKESDLDELTEAFEVFDSNGDGLIGPMELSNVLAKLGLDEWLGIDNCEMMIRVYDKDGDGAINLQEFRNLLEKAI